MVLKQIRIRGLGPIGELEIPLHSRVTAIHGPDGIGKSSVIAGAAALAMALPDRLGRRPHNVARVLDARVRPQGRAMAVDAVDQADNRWGHAWPGTGDPDWMGIDSSTGELQEWLDGLPRGAEAIFPLAAHYHGPSTTLADPTRQYAEESADPNGRTGLEAACRNCATGEGDPAAWYRWFRDNTLAVERNADDWGIPGDRQSLTSPFREAIGKATRWCNPAVTAVRPERLTLERQVREGEAGRGRIAIEALGDGERRLVGIVADLAWRMSVASGRRGDRLATPAVVTIDDIDLLLHPGAQQRVLPDLLETFPRVQFIVSTSSPLVLSTLRPEQIVELAWENGEVIAGGTAGWTYGAEAGDVLTATMGTPARPPGNAFADRLHQYMRLIQRDDEGGPEAAQLRQELEALSPEDPGLGRADLELRRRRVMEQAGSVAAGTEDRS